ncbi:MAG: bifunctional proline dehydrogenase/L-glutamate gamma-semialdehyde dehydrogenase PutA [Gammaproteobacteria bacterium]|nr:bifunctional proline dehydrogenase/L-glutamate gamma-semialdehyde dehydrogenase PutA [Gammaproteobacteria bacterium]
MARRAEELAAGFPPFLYAGAAPALDGLRESINRDFLADEGEVVERLIGEARLSPSQGEAVRERARRWVEAVRESASEQSGIEAFLHQYDLSSEEGVVLMCLAEALIRIPDSETADKLIRDKLARGDWSEKLGESRSLFVNASTWGLMLTGRLVGLSRDTEGDPASFLARMTQRAGEPIVRAAMRQAMRILGRQFVMGRSIGEGLARAGERDNRRYRYSFDMLGEAARTEVDAQAFQRAYREAIEAIGKANRADDIFDAHGISVKLSALYPRYEPARYGDAFGALVPRLKALAEAAKIAGIGLTVDAEEADRLDLSLDILEAVYRDPALEGYEGFGLAVQAYQKRAPGVIDWLAALAGEVGRRIPVRLVKGAYWDTEVKYSQIEGHSDYPVYTRKVNTDVCYLACAKRLLAAGQALYPQFASHNAWTVAEIVELAGDRGDYEFQRLHGMGEALYGEVLGEAGAARHCRVYAPVGAHRELLPYLVRRLLENGANTSFVHRISDSGTPIEQIIADPCETAQRNDPKSHPKIVLPTDLYAPERRNSRGINRADPAALADLAAAMAKSLDEPWRAAPIVGGKPRDGKPRPVLDPTDNRRVVGEVVEADAALVEEAVGLAVNAQPAWDRRPAAKRAEILERAADAIEARMPEFMALCVREAGKSIPDSVAEVREAVDHVRYNAMQCRRQFAEPLPLPGPTGESNRLELHGRGVFVCISPWNFPIAIFLAQVSGALAAGNAVIAKPAEQTSLIGHRAVAALLEAGVPGEVLHLLPGGGPSVGAPAVADARIAGVAFTGSTETARGINRTLAERDGSLATLIAETGGQNAMIVDSSALPEQVVVDVAQSAFGSCGQRCSALRVLCLQEEIADRVIEMLAGYMDTLRIGDPGLLATDVGPVIDHDARKMLETHVEKISKLGKVIAHPALPEACREGSFVAPLAVEIPSLDVLEREVFGPVLHVLRYRARDLGKLIGNINATGYGLTFGVHSRIESEAGLLAEAVGAGNCYINRNMVGAVVGVQPFGGCGLSGTGPKAGGPHYLARFATEKTVTVNTAAVGGNASLLALDE